MPEDFYHSISIPGESFYKEKGSKFIGFAVAIESKEDFDRELENLKKKYYDARHICTAFKLGDYEGKSDDGEPAHSAGDPILGQIYAHELDRVALFVVRYFGGTKLGVGGLKQAYKRAAQEAVENAGVVKKFLCEEIVIHFPYEQFSPVMKLISDFEAKVLEQNFTDSCIIVVELRLSKIDSFKSKLSELEYLGVEIISE